MNKLKSLREEAELKQKDISQLLNISRSTYTSYELERDTIPIKHLNTLCNYFNVSIDYALGISKEKTYQDIRQDISKELLMERLKELRKDNKLTQEKISKILNTSRSTWTGYEYGKYQIPTLLLFYLAKRYHYSIDYLLGKIDENTLK